jgi:hypothetical protein
MPRANRMQIMKFFEEWRLNSFSATNPLSFQKQISPTSD